MSVRIGRALKIAPLHSLNHFSRSGDNVVATSAAGEGDIASDIFIETSADFTEVNCLEPLTAHPIHILACITHSVRSDCCH